MIMDTNILEVRNKKYSLMLVNKGYELIDFKPCSDGVHCIFKYSDEALRAFKQLIAENKKRSYMLSDFDVKILVGYLEGYDIYDDDRYRLLSVFDKSLNRMDSEPSEEIVNGDVEQEIVLDEVSEETTTSVDISQLKKAMNGGK